MGAVVFLWYDAERKRFCLLAKDACENFLKGQGAGFYAESSDGIHYEIATPPKAYSKRVVFQNGQVSTPVNLERPSLLFQNGIPTHLYFAMGTGPLPYLFDDLTCVVCVPL